MNPRRPTVYYVFLVVVIGIHYVSCASLSTAKSNAAKVDNPKPESHAVASVIAETPISPNAFYSLNTYHGNKDTENDTSGYKSSYSGATGISGITDGKIDPSKPDTDSTSSFSNVNSGSFASASGVNSFGYAGTQAYQRGGMTPGVLYGSGNLYRDRDATKKNTLTGVGYMGTQLTNGSGLAGSFMGAHGTGFKQLKHSGTIKGGPMLRGGESDSQTAVATAQTQSTSEQDDRQSIGVASSEAESATLGNRSTQADVKIQTAVQALGVGLAGAVANAEAEGLITGDSKITASNSYSETYSIGSALGAAGVSAHATIDAENPGQVIRNNGSSMSSSGFSEINSTKSFLPTKSLLGGGSILLGNVVNVPVPITAQNPSKGTNIVGISDGIGFQTPTQTVGLHQESSESNPPGSIVSQTLESPQADLKVAPFGTLRAGSTSNGDESYEEDNAKDQEEGVKNVRRGIQSRFSLPTFNFPNFALPGFTLSGYSQPAGLNNFFNGGLNLFRPGFSFEIPSGTPGIVPAVQQMSQVPPTPQHGYNQQLQQQGPEQQQNEQQEYQKQPQVPVQQQYQPQEVPHQQQLQQQAPVQQQYQPQEILQQEPYQQQTPLQQQYQPQEVLQQQQYQQVSEDQQRAPQQQDSPQQPAPLQQQQNQQQIPQEQQYPHQIAPQHRESPQQPASQQQQSQPQHADQQQYEQPQPLQQQQPGHQQ